MSVKNVKLNLNDCLPKTCEALLTASCLSRPNDPIQFLKDTLKALQRHAKLQHDDWHKFVADAQQPTAASSRRRRTVDTVYMDPDYMDPDYTMMSFCLYEKAYCYYRGNLTRSCFRKWKRFVAKRKRRTGGLALMMDVAKMYYQRKCQHVALSRWSNWVKLHKKTQDDTRKNVERVIKSRGLKRIMAAWHNVATDSRRRKEYFKRMARESEEITNKVNQMKEGVDGLTVLPSSLSQKIFKHLDTADWLNCAKVSSSWKALIQSGPMWSQINFSVDKDRLTDNIVRQTLQSYRPYVIHLNMRGCTFLGWPGVKSISECKNLQDLNLSECSSITDGMVQRILAGCPCLLYLNLSCTLITNSTLRELSRDRLNLLYLSLAYCYRFTDKGFLYLTTGKGCHSLLHLDVSGCTQMTVSGFKYISAGCPSLTEIVIDDMPTLSDSCVLALMAGCRRLSAISLLDAPHLSDVALKAIAEGASLKSFRTEGNNQLTDISWKALCSSSEDLTTLHAAECPRMTNVSLKSVGNLNNLQQLDISLCDRVSDAGIQYLTDGSSSTKLKELNVSYCSRITDVSVRRIAQRFCKLNHLDVSYCERLTDLSLEWLSNSYIRSLDISGCDIRDQGLLALEGTRLKKLVVAECVHVTDFGMEKLCKNARDLEHVDVSHCVALSDLSIRAISSSCSGLVTLRMSGCPKMTDMGVQYLTSGSQYLQELDVSSCVLLTDRSLRFLERICPPLRSIKMLYCSSISGVAASRLQLRVEHLEHNNQNPPRWSAGPRRNSASDQRNGTQ